MSSGGGVNVLDWALIPFEYGDRSSRSVITLIPSAGYCLVTSLGDGRGLSIKWGQNTSVGDLFACVKKGVPVMSGYTFLVLEGGVDVWADTWRFLRLLDLIVVDLDQISVVCRR